MSTKTQSAVIEAMHARKSVRKFDSEFKLSHEEITALLTDAVSAPSSSNQQPWRFIVITDDESKKSLREFAYNQEQVETSSAIIAVLGDVEFYKNAKQIFQLSVDAGTMPQEIADKQTAAAEQSYGVLPKQTLIDIANFDAGLVSMQIMLAAKEYGLDTVAMGGYDKAAFCEKYDVPETQFPTILIALGKAIGGERGMKRLPVEQLTRFI